LEWVSAAVNFWDNPINMIFGNLQRKWLVWMGLSVFLVGARHAASQDGGTPVVGFTLDFPGSVPDHYVVSINADGRGTYTSSGKLSDQAEGGEDFHLEFAISDTSRNRVFDLARRAHYFDGKLDSGKKGLAFTGTKTLAYTDGQKNKRGSYNYSPVPAVQELTQFFQGLSATLEFGHRLEYYHRYQKLALDDETKRMEQMAKDKELVELSAIAPVLQQIAIDSTVINVVRARAQRLIDQAEQSNQP